MDNTTTWSVGLGVVAFLSLAFNIYLYRVNARREDFATSVLSENVKLRQRAAALTAVYDDQADHITRQAATISAQDVEIRRLQEALAGKTEAVQELSDEVANLGVYAVQLQETIEHLEEDPS